MFTHIVLGISVSRLLKKLEYLSGLLIRITMRQFMIANMHSN